MNYLLFTLLLLGTMLTPARAQIQWHDLEEAVRLSREEERKLLVFVYIDDCPQCEKMEKLSLAHPDVAGRLNKDFYAVRLNAERRAPLTFFGKEYAFGDNDAKSHELARELLRGKMAYPATAILTPEGELIQPIYGYQEPALFSAQLDYFSRDLYRKTPWSNYFHQLSKP